MLSPTDGGVTGLTPTFTGETVANAMVFVSIDKGTPQRATVERENWSYTTAAMLTEGAHTAEIMVRLPPSCATDCQCLCCSQTITFTAQLIDLTPTVTSPEEGAFVDTERPTITGKGVPGYRVQVTVDGQTGFATVNSGGTWSVTLPQPLSSGPHTLQVIQTDPEGNSSDPVERHITVATLETPVLLEPLDGQVVTTNPPLIRGMAQPFAYVYVTIEPIQSRNRRNRAFVAQTEETTADSQGNWSLTPAQPLPDGPVRISVYQENEQGDISPSVEIRITLEEPIEAPVIEEPADGSILEEGTFTVAGTGIPGMTLKLTAGGQPYQTIVPPDGQWEIFLTLPLTNGTQPITAWQADAFGNESASDQITVTIELVNTPTITSPFDNEKLYTSTFIVSGTGTPGNQILLTIGTDEYSGPVGLDGTWHLPLTNPLALGPHTIEAVEEGAGGTLSEPVSINVTVNELTALYLGTPEEGEKMSFRKPEFGCIGIPDLVARFELDNSGEYYYANIIFYGTDEDFPDPIGVVFYVFPEPLTDGIHTVSVRQQDRFGNLSPEATVTFEIGFLPAPVILFPTEGELINKNSPTFYGTAAETDRVAIGLVNQYTEYAAVGEDGTWSKTTSRIYPPGEYTLRVYSEIPDGFESPIAYVNFFMH